MRRALVACVLGLLCYCAASAQQKTDLEIAGLKGRVRSVHVEWAQLSAAGGKTVQSPRNPRQLTTYDEQGNATESTNFLSDGSVTAKRVHSKDAQGNLVTDVLDGDGKLIRKSVRVLNAQKQFSEVLIFGPNGEPLERGVTTRRADGRSAEDLIYDAKGVLLYKNVFSFDGQGKQTDFSVYDADGELMRRFASLDGGIFHSERYDERGNLLDESTFGPHTIEDIDPQGNWTEQHTPQKTTQDGHTREYVAVTYRTIEYYPAKKP